MSVKFKIFMFFMLMIFGGLSFMLGSVNIPIGDLLSGELTQGQATILFQMRLPRLVMAIIIGMLLATSGAVVQSVFANPIADPFVIGIASAATFGAVVAYLLKLPDFYYGIFGFIASAILSIAIFRFSRKSRGIATLLIIGIAISSFLGAFTSFATYLIGEDSFKIVAWMMGYIGSASWSKILILLPPLALAMVYFYYKRHELNLILSGDEEAKSLGVNVEKTKINLLVVSSLIIGFSVAFTGMIGFVSLIIPHTLRMLLRTSNNAILLPACAIMGAVFMLFCDTLAKNLLSPVEIPIGVITAFFGAPFFIYLAFRGGAVR